MQKKSTEQKLIADAQFALNEKNHKICNYVVEHYIYVFVYAVMKLLWGHSIAMSNEYLIKYSE